MDIDDELTEYAAYHGLDLGDVQEQYAQEYADEQSPYAEPEPEPEQFEQFEPAEQFDPTTGIAGYAARNHAQEEMASRARLAEHAAEQDAATFEQQLGRTLLERERDALADAQRAQFQRGEQLNVHGAAWEAGIKHWGEMTEDEITATMEARQSELSGAQPDIEVPVMSGLTTDAPLRVDWDQMTPDAIDQYMTMRLAGGELE